MTRLMALVLVTCATTCSAAFTWEGSSDTSVSTQANGAGNKAPSKNGDVFFDLATNPIVDWDLANGAASQIDDMTFGSDAGAFTINSDGTGRPSLELRHRSLPPGNNG